MWCRLGGVGLGGVEGSKLFFFCLGLGFEVCLVWVWVFGFVLFLVLVAVFGFVWDHGMVRNHL